MSEEKYTSLDGKQSIDNPLGSIKLIHEFHGTCRGTGGLTNSYKLYRDPDGNVTCCTVGPMIYNPTFEERIDNLAARLLDFYAEVVRLVEEKKS